MESLRTPTIKRKYSGLNPQWEIAQDIQNAHFMYMSVSITSYLSKYEDIRAPVKERKKKNDEIDLLSPVVRKLHLMDD